jgi:protein-L-isoaspartate(D-aspartate) O-methyltransferase
MRSRQGPEEVTNVLSDAPALRLALAERLARRGAVRSPEWRAAFERAPRHVFVPRFYRDVGTERHLVDGTSSGQRDEWLAGVHGDEALVIQYDSVNPTRPTSSSSMPTLMAVMLEALGVENGHRVLEIGTGSGYNAALLSERLGSELVTTVEIDAELVTEARERLAEAGYRPTVAVGDGWAGHAANAPYDRIIATGAVHRIPRAWVEQLTPGGVIVAVVSRGIVRVEVDGDGSAVGRFSRVPVSFVRLHGGPPLPPVPSLLRLTDEQGTHGPMTAPADILEDDAFWFFVRLALVPFEVRLGPREELDRVVDLADRSWARLNAGGQVVQGGGRRLWDLVEDAYRTWSDLGRPGRERFGLSVAEDGRQWAWLDEPESPNRWELALA